MGLSPGFCCRFDHASRTFRDVWPARPSKPRSLTSMITVLSSLADLSLEGLRFQEAEGLFGDEISEKCRSGQHWVLADLPSMVADYISEYNLH